jgi:hypothetical protein
MRTLLAGMLHRWKLVMGLAIALLVFSVMVGISGAYVLRTPAQKRFA